MKSELIARVAHEINRAYCASLGDVSQPAWDEAPEWQRKSALARVAMHLANPDATPEQSHESWLAEKLAQGWSYGPVKDAEKKQHPCCVPYGELPAEQKAKDYLFRAVVHALKDIPDAEVEVAAALEKVKALAAPAPAQQVKSVEPDTMALQYIGRRERWDDTVYRSGLYFTTDQVRNVPAGLARKFLRHRDLFREAPADEAAEVAVSAESAEQSQDDTRALIEQGKKEAEKVEQAVSQVQVLYDQIDRMDKAGVLHFASTQYKQELDGRRSVANLRADAKQLVDRFGVV